MCSRVRGLRGVSTAGLSFLLMASVVITACSATSTASLPPASVVLPHGWRTASYRTIDISVPGTWLIEPWKPNCGVSVPTVFIGPEGPNPLQCPAFNLPGAEVVFGAVPFGSPSGPSARRETIHGVKAVVYTVSGVHEASLTGAITRIWVNLPTEALTISVAVGESANLPGGAPGRAERIVRTIRHVHKAG